MFGVGDEVMFAKKINFVVGEDIFAKKIRFEVRRPVYQENNF